MIKMFTNRAYTKNRLKPWLVWLSGLSVGCKPKGRRFDSQSGHMAGLQARSPVGGHVRGNHTLTTH